MLNDGMMNGELGEQMEYWQGAGQEARAWEQKLRA